MTTESKEPYTVEQITAIFKDELSYIAGIDLSNIKNSARLDELNLDSLDLIELGLELEEAFVLKAGAADSLPLKVSATVEEATQLVITMVQNAST